MDGAGTSMTRLAFTADVTSQLRMSLASAAPQEGGAFCLVREGRGVRGRRLLVSAVIPPPEDAWELQAEDMLRPSARWVSAAVSHAISAGAGLAFVHSHPLSLHPPGLSLIDASSFDSLGRTIAPMLEGPFLAVVVHPTGWSAMEWLPSGLRPIDGVVQVGRVLTFLNAPVPALEATAMDTRQVDALGVVHQRLRALTAAVVGCGGLGSPIAEQLVRMGVRRVFLLDDDALDTPSNLRRVFGARGDHLGLTPPPSKAEIVAGHLRSLNLGPEIEAVYGDVRNEFSFRHILDADVVFGATDTHGSRAILNELASTYLLPVIDVGVRVGSRKGAKLSGLVGEVRVLTPATPCLWCRGTIDGDVIRLENLPRTELESLRRDGYVPDGFAEPAPSVAALTVMTSGLATCALLALLSEDGAVVPSGYWVDGFQGDAGLTKPEVPRAGCRCRSQLGLGDSSSPPLLVPTAD